MTRSQPLEGTQQAKSRPTVPIREQRRQILRYARDAFVLGFLLYAALTVTEYATVRHLPPGESFVLTSRGWGAIYEFAIGTLLVSAAAVLYGASAFGTRWRWAGWVLRGFIFLVLVVVLTAMEATSAVAVVRSGDTFQFIRRIPFGSERLTPKDIDEVQISAGKWNRELYIVLRRHPSLPGYLRTQPAWRGDAETNQTLDRLIESLRGAGVRVRSWEDK